MHLASLPSLAFDNFLRGVSCNWSTYSELCRQPALPNQPKLQNHDVVGELFKVERHEDTLKDNQGMPGQIFQCVVAQAFSKLLPKRFGAELGETLKKHRGPTSRQAA